ncbi:MAG: ribosomal protein [Deltaproteobacteria bacterium]|nr:ribosomal protein [Deltaproteobacteria bacterium]MBP1718552.1 ribosomal protein [Deltaproteobacteria bacterium]
MATHFSAIKRARQNEKRRLRNKMVKSVIKTHAKKILQALEEKNHANASGALKIAVPAMQRAASKRVLHKKTVSRRISRLAKKVNALKAQA